MSSSKIKNIVIAALVFLNIVLLCIIISDAVGRSSRENDLLEKAAALMGESGIALDARDIEYTTNMVEYEIERNAGVEETAAEAFLGECSVSNQGGAIYTYESELGHAVFYSGGEFDVTLNTGAYPVQDKVERAAEKVLKDLGADADIVSQSGNTAGGTVLAVCKLDGTQVCNCIVEISFEGGCVIEISGRLIAGTPDSGQNVEILTSPTVLMEFLRQNKSGNIRCNAIYSVRAVYILYLSAFGKGNLSPVWMIETDNGEYYIDAVSGTLFSPV